MKHFPFGKLNKDDKGMTLIEVIVSLLILAVIFTPMIMTFVRAHKLNQTTKNENYATELAESVMEAVKVLGIEATAKEFYGSKSDFSLASIEDESTISEEKYDARGDSIVNVAGEKIFWSRLKSVTEEERRTKGSVPYVFEIKNAKSGTSEFDVKITFSSASYSNSPSESYAAPGDSVTPTPTPVPNNISGPDVGFKRSYSKEGSINNFSFADMSAFNGKTTALINPGTGGDYDYMAKQYFYNLYSNYQYDIYVQKCAEIDAINNAALEDYFNRIDNGESATYPNILEYPAMPALMSEEELAAKVSKTTEVFIDANKDPHGNDIYVLNSRMTFSFSNINVSGEGILADASNSTVERVYSGYCTNVAFPVEDEINNGVESIFLMYNPFSYTGGVATFTNETIIINYAKQPLVMNPNNLSIYLVAQERTGGNSITASHKLNVMVNNSTSSKITLNSNAGINAGGIMPDYVGRELLKDITGDMDRIYVVTVDIYEAGTLGTADENKIYGLSSTVLNE